MSGGVLGTSTRIELNDVLNIMYPHSPAWSRDSSRIAFLWNDGGLTRLWGADAASDYRVEALSPADANVSGFSWGPGGKLVWAQDGEIWLDGRPYIKSLAKCSSPIWSPHGERFGFIRDGCFVVCDHGVREIAVPDHLQSARLCVSPRFRWSPSGEKIAAVTLAPGKLGLVVFGTNGDVHWRYSGSGLLAAYSWLCDSRLLLTVNERPDHRVHYLLTLADASMDVLLSEEGDSSLGTLIEPQPDPSGNQVLFVLYEDKWAHLYLVDIRSGAKRQLTAGSFDDYAIARDRPQWAPDGKSFVFSSNRVHPNQRQLHVFSLDTMGTDMLTSTQGTDCFAQWSPDGRTMVFTHADSARSPDLWLADVGSGGLHQLTRSMPEVWSEGNTVTPEHITIRGHDGLEVHACLYLPIGFDPSVRYPALIYVHGGVTIQMRHGWYPSESDAIRHAWHQYMLQRGYVVLFIDYRGSIGYGLDYQTCLWGRVGVDDLADCVSAAEWLKQQPWIVSDRVAIWGQSYGGYLTLAAMTKAPEVFTLGISTAGVWDWGPLLEWRTPFDPGMDTTSRFRILSTLQGEEAVEAWHQAMPRNFVSSLSRPLFSLMGTADEAVPIEQQDQLVLDCLDEAKDFAAVYYPGEFHGFRWRASWRDLFTRVEQVLERYLKGDRSYSGRASI